MKTQINSTPKSNKEQNRYLLIVLWLFPFLIINLGWNFINTLEFQWAINEKIDNANQMAESLSAKSDFPFILAATATRFNSELETGTSSFSDPKQKDNLLTLIKNRANKYFEKPFPQHELFVFHINKANPKAELTYSNAEKNPKLNELASTFEFLVKTDSNDFNYLDNQKAEDISAVKNVLGINSISSAFEKGKTSCISLENKSRLFVWNYFKNKITDDIFGYLLFVNNDVLYLEAIGKQLAIHDLEKSQINTPEKNYVAFIPLNNTLDAIYSSKELTDNPEFSELTKKWTYSKIIELFNNQLKNKNSNPEYLTLGNHKTFFYIAPNKSHATAVLAPIPEKAPMPLWLIIINICVAILVIIFLLRGFVFNKWPEPSLNTRFTITYCLAACLPIGLFCIVFYAYTSEFKLTQTYNIQSHLKLNIGQIESQKVILQKRYKSSFKKLAKDRLLSDSLKQLETADRTTDKGLLPEAKNVLSRAIHIIGQDDKGQLPFLSLSIIDEYGNFYSNLGNSFCAYYKSFNGNEYLDHALKINTNINTAKSKYINKQYVEKNINNIAISLRNQIKATNPNAINWQNNLDSNTISNENNFQNILNNKGEIYSFSANKQNLNQIFDYLYVDGIPRFAIHLCWDENDMDLLAINTGINYFAINDPEISFSAYKHTSYGIIPWIISDRYGEEHKKLSHIVAEQAYFNQNTAKASSENLTAIAIPSRVYNDTIIVAEINKSIDYEIFKRFYTFLIIIFVVILVLIASIRYSALNTILPIEKLKEFLDKISNEKFNTSIKNSGTDEFQTLSQEFAKMAKSLDERHRLATLISDNAIEAISKNKNDDDIPLIETFYGTALVSDMRNFTGICENHTPEETTELLNEHFARVTEIVSKNGGRIYKYIGDAIEVIFAESDNLYKNSAERALKSACEMLEYVKAANKKRSDKGLFEYKIGIGLALGNMAGGAIGSKETRLDYAIIGDVIDNAAKLEAVSKKNPDFPLIIDKNVADALKGKYNDILFTCIEKTQQPNAYIIQESSLDIFYENNKTVETNNIDLSEKNINESNDKYLQESNQTIETNYIFSFRHKFTVGILFLLLLTAIMGLGVYFVYTTAHESEKIQLAIENQRKIKQIICEDRSKNIFDIKCRDISEAIEKQIESSSNEQISDEEIIKVIDKSIISDKSLANIDISRIFVKLEKPLNINLKSADFINNIQIKTIANNGFTELEANKIGNYFKINIALNELDGKNHENISNDFIQSSKKYIQEKYPENSINTFSDNIMKESYNASTECFFRNKSSYIFNLDFKNKNNDLIGYLLITIPIEQIENSIELLLSSFSKDENIIAIKNRKSEEWYFSDNMPEGNREKAIKAEVNNKKVTVFGPKAISNEYFAGLLGVVNLETINIDGKDYDIYLTKLCELNKGNPRKSLIIIFFVTIALFIFLWKLSKGTSSVNKSISRKLWLSLIIVSVIPIISVFFVFGKFIGEYYTIKYTIQHNELQRYCKIISQNEKISEIENDTEDNFKIYKSSSLRPGNLSNMTNNKLKIPFGGYANWIVTSNLPISTSLKINQKEWYLIESITDLKSTDSIIFVTYPIKIIYNEIFYMQFFFYLLLGSYLLTIINFNKNIIEDITYPINVLLNGVKEVNQENFGYRINSDRKDELGDLCLSFDTMNKGLESKQMMSKMISKTAQTITLKESINTNQKSNCIILYISIPEFNSIIANFGEYKTFDYLKTQTAIISGIIMNEGGEIDKIIADKMLAVFRTNNNTAEIISSACKAAKEIIDQSESNKLPLKVAIGMNYGSVISGFLGAGNKRDFTVIGDAVNVAARIESKAEEIKSHCCLISETVKELLTNDFSTEEIGEVPLKGKTQQIKIYKLL